jgi:ribosomal peptide maturation radical SAM protein 1
MSDNNKSLLLVSMPFAETSIPSIQLALLESYLAKRDVNVSTRHLYLKAAEFYGLDNYNFLINSPNDSHTAQMVFSKYVFSEHWEKNQKKFKYFYENIICYKQDFLKKNSFEKYVEETGKFIEWTIKNLKFENYDIIGFTLNYGQFLPSLAIAKQIKEKNPEKQIIFGGSTSINELGQRILSTFNYIDFIISGEGEETLFLLINNFKNYKNIPGLIYREKNDSIWNKNNNFIDMNNLPYPNFQSYFNELSNTPSQIIQYQQLYGRLPIELSRGCWWNNCTFCNIRAYNKKYREKNFDRFADELQFLSDKHKMLHFQVIGTTLPQNNYKTLCKKIIKLNRDFSLIIESRAGILKSTDYGLLKKAGFKHIQTGIETMSSNYLKKINKGTKIIDNIAALKYCKENHIKNTYNFIIDYPNEENIDFNETQKNIILLQKYLEPPNISKFVVGYQSPIYRNPEKYNIKNLEPTVIDKIMYPEEIIGKKFCFFYSYKRKKEIKENPWKELINTWSKIYYQQKILGVKRDTELEKLIFYFIDGYNFIKIYDKRFGNNAIIHILNKKEREVFLECKDIISFYKLKENLNNIKSDELENILQSFVEAGIFYKEDDLYLALPISYRQYYNDKSIINTTDIEQIRTYLNDL